MKLLKNLDSLPYLNYKKSCERNPSARFLVALIPKFITTRCLFSLEILEKLMCLIFYGILRFYIPCEVARELLIPQKVMCIIASLSNISHFLE